MRERTETITWETDLALFSRRMLAQWSAVMAITALVMSLILGSIFIAQKEWNALLPMLGMTVGGTAGLWLLGLIIMAVLFRGKIRVRYTLDNKGIRYETSDTKAKTANRLAIVVGALARSPQTVGAGLIARSQEAMAVRWTGAFRAIYDPGRYHITLRNQWRPLLWVQCTSDNYASVAAAVENHMAYYTTGQRTVGRSPLPAYLGRTVLVLFGSLPLFPLAEEYHTGLFVPICILCFGIATVWLINLFGWVVIGGLLVQAGLVVTDMLRLRKSYFFKGQSYRGYELLGTDDFQLMLVAGVGAGILVWLSISALRGRWFSALLAGYQDMG